MEKEVEDKEKEIQTLLNTIHDNPGITRNNDLKGQIKHLEIQLQEAKEGYVDVNNIPFDTAVQVLAKGDFPEPEKGKGFKFTNMNIDAMDMVSGYGMQIALVASSAREIVPLFGDKKKPSNICNIYGVKIDDYGHPIYTKKISDEEKAFIEFCRQVDIAHNHSIQNIQGVEYAIKKVGNI